MNPYIKHTTITIPPNQINKISIYKQSFLENFLFKKFLNKFGLSQLGTYYRTLKRDSQVIYPYMPEKFPEDAYLYDFHCHSYYSDGKGDFRHILNQIRQKKHLNGLAFTDHPWYIDNNRKRILNSKVIKRSYKAASLVESLIKLGKLPKDFVTFPGSCEFFMHLNEEAKSPDIELIALGLSIDFISKLGGLKKITRMNALEFIERVHEDNGLIILPHPFYFNYGHKLLKSKELTINSTPDAFESLNYTIGFLFDKIYHPLFNRNPVFYGELVFLSQLFGYFNWMARIISQRNNYGKNFDYPTARKIAAVGSSDAHFLTMVGAGCTMTESTIESIEDLRNIFKKKKTIPMINKQWSDNTLLLDVSNEIFGVYGHKINEFIHNSEKGVLNKVILYKIAIRILSTILELKMLNNKNLNRI
ncbi:MAG: PHP domain-containing protein [Promethearchaeota archaeon]